MTDQKRVLSLTMATSLVVSAMIGTGIFTSLGFQLVGLTQPLSILMLWIAGGIVAFCGAVSYAYLGRLYPRSGGEYHLLSKIYHPSVGFLAGWVSVTVGFAAPAAIAAIAFSEYLRAWWPNVPMTHTAALTVVLLNVLHATSIKWGSRFQTFFTWLKVIVLIGFILLGLLFGQVDQNFSTFVFSEIMSSSFAISLVFVLYAYTGWNAAIYVVDEIKDVARNLNRSLLFGTLIVLVLYLLVNVAFLKMVPKSVMEGQVEVGLLAVGYAFGDKAGALASLIISILLVSTISAYVFVGPRVAMIMGQDFKALGWLSKTNRKGIPVSAFGFSTFLSLVFIYTSTFEQVLVYTTFLLILMSTLTVAGIWVEHFQGHVMKMAQLGAAALFVLVNLWVMYYVVRDKPLESIIGFGVVLAGLSLFFIFQYPDEEDA